MTELRPNNAINADRERMFGFFRKKKLYQIAANIATMVNISLWSLRLENSKKLPEKLSNDKFVLGYIMGVAVTCPPI